MSIKRFFVGEYIAFYGELHDDIDILEIGFWDYSGKYTGPEEDFRGLDDFRGESYDNPA